MSRQRITQDLNVKAEESVNYLVAITQWFQFLKWKGIDKGLNLKMKSTSTRDADRLWTVPAGVCWGAGPERLQGARGEGGAHPGQRSQQPSAVTLHARGHPTPCKINSKSWSRTWGIASWFLRGFENALLVKASLSPVGWIHSWFSSPASEVKG